MIKNCCVVVLSMLLLSSCASREEIVYFQGGDQKSFTTNYDPKFKPDDLLMINVSAPDIEAAVPFNIPVTSVAVGVGANAQLQYQLYLIDKDNNIEFPVLGTLKIGGLKRNEAILFLKEKLKAYINTPIVNIRIMNFKISVLGEVARPGNYTIASERIALPDALALAGDLTVYGKRNNITVIREVEGVKITQKVDITQTAFMNSDFYYLGQNDIVYVEPNKTKVNSSSVGPNTSVIISSLSLLVTVIAILTR